MLTLPNKWAWSQIVSSSTTYLNMKKTPKKTLLNCRTCSSTFVAWTSQNYFQPGFKKRQTISLMETLLHLSAQQVLWLPVLWTSGSPTTTMTEPATSTKGSAQKSSSKFWDFQTVCRRRSSMIWLSILTSSWNSTPPTWKTIPTTPLRTLRSFLIRISRMKSWKLWLSSTKKKESQSVEIPSNSSQVCASSPWYLVRTVQESSFTKFKKLEKKTIWSTWTRSYKTS